MTNNVSMQDVRAAGFCSKGARELATRLDLDWNEFITNGLPVEAFEPHKDQYHVKKLLEVHNGKR
jgi:hypothetical protein